MNWCIDNHTRLGQTLRGGFFAVGEEDLAHPPATPTPPVAQEKAEAWEGK